MKRTKNNGVTMVEVMVAAVLIVVVVLAAAAFRYVTALDARKADIQSTAARVGLMLLEGWKAQGGQVQGDPTPYQPEGEFTTDLANGIVVVSTFTGGPASPSYMTNLETATGKEHFQIKDNNMYFYATLCYQDVADEPRRLNAIVGWLPGAIEGKGADAVQNIRLTTYVLPN